jgi:hypothetical protein
LANLDIDPESLVGVGFIKEIWNHNISSPNNIR